MLRTPTLIAVLTLPLAACVPAPAEPARSDGGGNARPAYATPAKPPKPQWPLPPNVIRVVNPDGSVSIRIIDPPCPTNCGPWTP